MTCKLCNGKTEFIYKMNGFNIIQCKNCKTCCVEQMPDDEKIKEFYNNFIQNITGQKLHVGNLGIEFKQWFQSFNLPENAKMLDIGGGNGKYCLAFEKFGIGNATFIDLDKVSCDFVKTIGISNVINDNVCNLKNYSDIQYDFIYSRHVIEHLINPIKLINSAIDLLAPNGVFILQCPNGLSHEEVLNKTYYKKHKKRLKQSNNFNNIEASQIICSDKFAFGLDPIRHLWAFSPKGIEEILKQRNDIIFEIKTYSITDPIYSPSRAGRQNFKQKILVKFMGGGAHLVAIIRKKVNK